jgi:pyruvate kinase
MPRRDHRTKIVATVGPASWSVPRLHELIVAGVDVFRINFSHGELERHAETVDGIRRAARRAGRVVGLLGDLQGPRVRLGVLREKEILLKRGATVELVGGADGGRRGAVDLLPVSYPRFARDVFPGARILIADGEIELRVERVLGDRVVAAVVCGGKVQSRKGINLPECNISIPTLTAKDRRDLAFMAAHDFDAVAVSFVGSAGDIRLARSLLRRAGSDAMVIAKIERGAAVARLGEILKAADGAMVARGDLAVEAGYDCVPILQKRIVRESLAIAKPAIVATQMLDSMISHPRPTRAEASDVANAIFDGADAVMLSGETAVGEHPVETVRTMARIIRRAEAEIQKTGFLQIEIDPALRAEGAIARAGVRTAVDVGARCIVPFTTSGRTARLVSRERPSVPIVSFAESESTMRRLCFYWGVVPKLLKGAPTMGAHFVRGERELRRDGFVEMGDCIIFLAGLTRMQGATNTLRIHRVTGAKKRKR